MLAPTLLITLFTIINLYGEVTAPNYYFTIKQFKPLSPGSAIAPAIKQYPDHTQLKEKGGIKLYQFNLNYQHYKFTVLVQSFDGKVLDMFARLPTYFLHDIFHQSLIDIYGKQERYFRQERSAIYIWNNENGNRHIYSGSCTITCFPDYYTIMPVAPPPAMSGSYQPLIEQMKLGDITKK
ncbi:MAG: hypothetical protein HN353_05105 [Bdellovibrionales bacterium]|nr:hypothetical protein [Bdellovibrionales bacterium]MBT3524985.1 hypothetical protein [Bdellovibrionales bacterium]MBT7669576.1 hypothetical protein [Bdellovibrionales bacterium]